MWIFIGLACVVWFTLSAVRRISSHKKAVKYEDALMTEGTVPLCNDKILVNPDGLEVNEHFYRWDVIEGAFKVRSSRHEFDRVYFHTVGTLKAKHWWNSRAAVYCPVCYEMSADLLAKMLDDFKARFKAHRISLT